MRGMTHDTRPTSVCSHKNTLIKFIFGLRTIVDLSREAFSKGRATFISIERQLLINILLFACINLIVFDCLLWGNF